jgi:hypothetical protein
VRVRAEVALGGAEPELRLTALAVEHAPVLDLQADLALGLDPWRLRSLRLETGWTPVDPLYRRYLQPVLAAGPLASVAWEGQARLSLELPRDGPGRVRLGLRELGLRDLPDPALEPHRAPRFAWSGVAGELWWSADGAARPSRLAWSGGQLLGTLEFGAAALEAQLHGRRLHLLAPLRLPLLDGELAVDRLELALPAGESVELDFDAILTPVSLQRLGGPLGWPPLAGSVSGVIPGLALRRDGVTLQGNLLVRIFDGDIVIRRLRLSDPFGALPALSADVELKRLDLETLTRAFSFGRITGRLDGRIAGLHLEGWRPVAFDAEFATPPGDDSPHFISQRAVDNLSSLGGAGIGGSLSRTFLGLFEEFRYDRLGISCRLADGVCHMGGVAPADAGYYLVTGSGLPQINIKGYNRATDWDRLVQQLRQISASGAPVVDFDSQPKGP